MGQFANIFKTLRVTRGYTQEELSKRLGISRSRIGMYETGAREPDFETLESIADFFNVDIDYLVGRTNKTTYIPESHAHKNDKSDGYYTDPETAMMAQELFENKDLRILFDAARDAKPQDLKMAADMLKRFKETNPDG